MTGAHRKPIKTKRGEVERTKRTESMKNPRRCIVCATTKDADSFSKWILHVCEQCVEKPPKKKARDEYQG